ncbi:SDR family NAD(P)-dependent oxidoreductase [Vibrio sp. SCSIO 43137]|uniref:SDR family NAD(P)-dependent oxidoreductase n=1 Tax=Vibrio sp. SCSIO 43137 TaxID=3021011 RepID=UPI0023082BD9|nr:SDR family NAD(P)-dependent oxidoreductase [Vibrio sp. SCSIO 43137]WCE28373.1 SDR family NAD(P)-dependent oxidoreductase [Vibrio sp. SCSIO 43137]
MSRIWTTGNLPEMKNRAAIVTGGNRGLGYESALALAKAGCSVVIACRDEQKGNHSVERIKAQVEGADVRCLPLDLTCQKSIAIFADQYRKLFSRLDILLNNAGVVNLSELRHTDTGDEMHLATNHLGHFSLTGQLVDLIANTPLARVVTVTSGGYKFGEIRFDDIDWTKRPYHRVKSYGDSKLANLLFSRSLNKLFLHHKIDAIALSAHPGLTASERQQSEGIGGPLSKLLASPLSCGVQPLLRSCCDPVLTGGELIGPKFGIRGKPVCQKITSASYNDEMADALWAYSVKKTGVRYLI